MSTPRGFSCASRCLNHIQAGFIGPCHHSRPTLSLKRSRTRLSDQHRHLATAASTTTSDRVRIVEVGPRDGLQNEKTTIPLETKIELIRRLAETGVQDIEGGSFVAPKWVPQMANSMEVLSYILATPPPSVQSVAYNFLVPNAKGFDNFLRTLHAPSRTQSPPTPPPSPTSTPGTASFNAAGAASTEVSIFAAATESFSKANINCSIAESLERFKPILQKAKAENVRVRGYVSVALGCPYEGIDVDPVKVAEVTRSLLEMGADEVSVADTTGMGTAPRTRKLLEALAAAGIAKQDLALHFHDTYGQALVNTVVGLEHGIRTFDSSVGGLGGCPYSKGATGNVATEDLVYCLHTLGVHTGIDVQKMAQIGSWVSRELGRENDSRAGKAILARLSA